MYDNIKLANSNYKRRLINLNTKLTELLNIKYPIIQGAMAWISESNLVSAVANAGATGVIACGGRSLEWIKTEIRRTKELTDKPFGVNIMLMDQNKDAIVDAVCKEKVNFVTLGAGNPLPYFEKFHKAGIKTIPVVPNTKLAKRVEEAGADAVIIEGMEAGGHIGKLTTMALMTNVIPQISIPVIPAGGIVDGRGIAAAIVMGAQGVQMESRFLLADECTLHPEAKQKIIEAKDTDSVVTGYSRGHGVRGLRNTFTDKYLELEIQGASQESLNKLAVGTNRLAAIDGDTENGLVQVGQSLNPLNEINPAKAIVQDLIKEAELVLNRVKF
ncbi:nitronate monooxygenase [Wukongibacter sp. M2B1]|uniref:nitronate monooxygenase n=1 Tax=Wukongibacter sp. M2B1 TaxID=3088895 RepID=UPI003D78D7AD